MMSDVDREVTEALAGHAEQPVLQEHEPEDGDEEPDGGLNNDLNDHIDAFEQMALEDGGPVPVVNDQQATPAAFGLDEQAPSETDPAGADVAPVDDAHGYEHAAPDDLSFDDGAPTETADAGSDVAPVAVNADEDDLAAPDDLSFDDGASTGAADGGNDVAQVMEAFHDDEHVALGVFGLEEEAPSEPANEEHDAEPAEAHNAVAGPALVVEAAGIGDVGHLVKNPDGYFQLSGDYFDFARDKEQFVIRVRNTVNDVEPPQASPRD
ncbi:hypothetical protein AAVH_39096, partial [Aphelenchoides avenae]